MIPSGVVLILIGETVFVFGVVVVDVVVVFDFVTDDDEEANEVFPVDSEDGLVGL